MKLILLILFLTHPLWACHSLQRFPVSVGLKDKSLCRPVNDKTYDISFGQKLALKATALRAELKAVNTDFLFLELKGSELEGDFRDLHGRGAISETTFIHADFRFANLRNYTFIEVKFDEVRFQGANFKGTDLRQVTFNNCDLAGAIFDLRTKLPFSVDEALEKGMVIK